MRERWKVMIPLQSPFWNQLYCSRRSKPEGEWWAMPSWWLISNADNWRGYNEIPFLISPCLFWSRASGTHCSVSADQRFQVTDPLLFLSAHCVSSFIHCVFGIRWSYTVIPTPGHIVSNILSYVSTMALILTPHNVHAQRSHETIWDHLKSGVPAAMELSERANKMLQTSHFPLSSGIDGSRVL